MIHMIFIFTFFLLSGVGSVQASDAAVAAAVTVVDDDDGECPGGSECICSFNQKWEHFEASVEEVVGLCKNADDYVDVIVSEISGSEVCEICLKLLDCKTRNRVKPVGSAEGRGRGTNGEYKYGSFPFLEKGDALNQSWIKGSFRHLITKPYDCATWRTEMAHRVDGMVSGDSDQKKKKAKYIMAFFYVHSILRRQLENSQQNNKRRHALLSTRAAGVVDHEDGVGDCRDKKPTAKVKFSPGIDKKWECFKELVPVVVGLCENLNYYLGEIKKDFLEGSPPKESVVDFFSKAKDNNSAILRSKTRQEYARLRSAVPKGKYDYFQNRDRPNWEHLAGAPLINLLAEKANKRWFSGIKNLINEMPCEDEVQKDEKAKCIMTLCFLAIILKQVSYKKHPDFHDAFISSTIPDLEDGASASAATPKTSFRGQKRGRTDDDSEEGDVATPKAVTHKRTVEFLEIPKSKKEEIRRNFNLCRFNEIVEKVEGLTEDFRRTFNRENPYVGYSEFFLKNVAYFSYKDNRKDRFYHVVCVLMALKDLFDLRGLEEICLAETALRIKDMRIKDMRLRILTFPVHDFSALKRLLRKDGSSLCSFYKSNRFLEPGEAFVSDDFLCNAIKDYSDRSERIAALHILLSRGKLEALLEAVESSAVNDGRGAAASAAMTVPTSAQSRLMYLADVSSTLYLDDDNSGDDDLPYTPPSE